MLVKVIDYRKRNPAVKEAGQNSSSNNNNNDITNVTNNGNCHSSGGNDDEDIDTSCSSTASFFDDHQDNDQEYYNGTVLELESPTCTTAVVDDTTTHSDAALLRDIATAAHNHWRLGDSFSVAADAAVNGAVPFARNVHKDNEPDDLDFTCWELEEGEEEEEQNEKETKLQVDETQNSTVDHSCSESCPATPRGDTIRITEKKKKEKAKSNAKKKAPGSPKKSKKKKVASSSSSLAANEDMSSSPSLSSLHKLSTCSSHHLRHYDEPESPAEAMLVDMQKTADELIRRVRARIKRAVARGKKSLQMSVARHLSGSRLSSTMITMRQYDKSRRRATHWAVVKQRLEDVSLTLDRELRRARFDGRMNVAFTMDPAVANNFTAELKCLHAIIENQDDHHGNSDETDNQKQQQHQHDSIELSHRAATDKELIAELEDFSKSLPDSSQAGLLSPRKSRHLRNSQHGNSAAGTPLSPSKTRRDGKRPESAHGSETLPTMEAL